jgi:hypothetical protein
MIIGYFFKLDAETDFWEISEKARAFTFKL